MSVCMGPVNFKTNGEKKTNSKYVFPRASFRVWYLLTHWWLSVTAEA